MTIPFVSPFKAPQIDVILKITCGCHTQAKPAQFDNINDAAIHARETNHTLHGVVVINRK